MLASAACGDSLHLDPASTGGSTSGGGTTATTTTSTGSEGGGGSAATTTTGATTTTTTTSTTGTGGGAPGCNSNADCPADPAAPEASICDTFYHTCVECLVFADCAFRPGTVCSNGTCACGDPVESYCGAPARCVDLDSSPADCGSCGHACFVTCGGGKCTDAWEPTETDDAPDARARHVAVWTDTNKMVVWGGETPGHTDTGGIYDPATGKWTATTTAGAPSKRSRASAVWTKGANDPLYMIVWGGQDTQGALATGGRFDPKTNTWFGVSTTGAPPARWAHTAVWNDVNKKMYIWGGKDAAGAVFNDVYSYDPVTDSWATLDNNVFDAVSMTTFPMPPRNSQTSVWTQSLMITFGGFDAVGTPAQDGYSFNPAAQWTAISNLGAPSARGNHTAIWTGADMIVWGGFDNSTYLSTGAEYNLNANLWTAMPAPPAGVSGRRGHSAVWSSVASKMIVWGGEAGGAHFNDGASYDPATNMWNVSPMPTAPSGRAYHTALLTNTNKMLVWGGETSPGSFTSTGALFDPALAP